MSVIDVFWEFIYEHHPQLAFNDWLVDSQLMNVEEIVNAEVRELIPHRLKEVNCIVYFYEGGTKNVVYLLQDKQGKQNIAIGLLKNDELVDAVNLS
ncbi:hypothetical protein [Thalassobacillus sp. CUG 92003]|uniref:hypothetical protein n=1 Tax=Thalassobacillus sp. CUG 92003 TaxID=2736641 RepID=UPI0015E63EB4|nr:hypothetical protein [Thalassobacillus sp. CUG 92003]